MCFVVPRRIAGVGLAMLKQYIKKLIHLAPTIYTKRVYRQVFGKSLDLANPQGFNERILWLKLNHYRRNPLIVRCADKYRMRSYVNEMGLGDILPELYGVYQKSSEIDWQSLPNKFAIKCNHGCGFNIICDDKNRLDMQDACRKLDRWLKTDFGIVLYEPHYSQIRPLIFSEQYVEAQSGKLPHDYKIYCFYGEPKVVRVGLERETQLRLEWYDLNWNVLKFGKVANQQKAKRPYSLKLMLQYARVLSAPFPFVRVDFYELSGKPKLGEMTFTPAAGFAQYYSENGNRTLGEMFGDAFKARTPVLQIGTL